MISSDGEKPKTLLGKIKRKIRWKNFIKDTLKLVDRDMKAQQDVTIKKVAEEMMDMDLPIMSEKILMEIIESLKVCSPNLKALRENYATLKRDFTGFFAAMDKILGDF